MTLRIEQAGNGQVHLESLPTQTIAHTQDFDSVQLVVAGGFQCLCQAKWKREGAAVDKVSTLVSSAMEILSISKNEVLLVLEDLNCTAHFAALMFCTQIKNPVGSAK